MIKERTQTQAYLGDLGESNGQNYRATEGRNSGIQRFIDVLPNVFRAGH
jgi:hypothetical protein